MWGHTHRCFYAVPDAPSAARRCVSEWLRELGWSGTDLDDVVLSVSEAITNAVEHAYPPGHPGSITMDAATLTGPNGTQRIHVTVTDQGTWRTPKIALAVVGSVSVRGRGLGMIRATMETLRLDTDASGTRLTMMTREANPISQET